jgi:hypothetical protein
VHDHFRPLLQAVLSPNKSVYVDTASWTRVAEKHVIADNNESNTVYFLALLNTSLFLNSILLGANIEETMLHDWLVRRYKIQFQTAQEIYVQLRPLPADLGKRLEIHDFGFKRLFSKWQANKKDRGGRSVLAKMQELAVSQFGNERFLYTLNKDADDKQLVAAGGIRIPAVAHGLNEYQTFTNVFFGAALTNRPDGLCAGPVWPSSQCVAALSVAQVPSNTEAWTKTSVGPAARVIFPCVGVLKAGLCSASQQPREHAWNQILSMALRAAEPN